MLTKYDLVSGQYVMGFLGNDPRKNTAGLLKGWAISKSCQQGAKLVLFGRDGNPSVFAAHAENVEAEKVVRVGGLSDDGLAKLYSCAAAFVFPSYYEGFGLPVIEAASCGCRVVTTARGALPEVSPPDALVVNPDSPEEIAHAIDECLTTQSTAAQQSDRVVRMKMFDWDEAARTYQGVFDRRFV